MSTLADRTLGKTDIAVTPIGLGVWQFSQGKSIHRLIWQGLDEETQDAIVRAALDGGINWFDTAEAYGSGASERGLSAALQRANAVPGQVVIATKWSPFLRRASSITSTIGDRQDNLAPYPIDLHQIHQPYAFSSIADQMAAMAALVHDGRIGAVGVSNFDAAQMLEAHRALQDAGLPLAANQVKYSLLDRAIESNGVLETARALGITIIAYSPLEMGLLSGKFHADSSLVDKVPLGRRWQIKRKLGDSASLVDALRDIGVAHQATPSQVALNWLVNFHGETVVAIPGASKARHAQESAGAMSFTLNAEELDRLDALTR
jgi:aryl-alcohol dehydrogenase-like predicted oxidoreductase